MAKPKKDIEDLRFIRIYDFGLIPRKYIEAVVEHGGADFTVERLLELAPLITKSPRELLYALADKDHAIKGYLWCSVNPLSMTLDITNISVDAEYQGNGQYLNILTPHVRDLRKQLKLKSSRWLTTRPEIYESHGFVSTGQTMIREDDDFDLEAFIEKMEEK